MQRKNIKSIETCRGIGIAATSTIIESKLLQSGLKKFARWQIPVLIDDRVYAEERIFAGSDTSRAQVMLALLRNPQIGTIWCARGGYGATRILSLLDKGHAPLLLKKNPKLLLGFSDVTALHFYFYEQAGLASVHAPMPATTSWLNLPARTDKILRTLLAGELALGKKSYTTNWPTKTLANAKEVEGIVVGGNLTLLANLIGTPWQPNLKGKILFLEDCGEAPYRVDRALVHLANAGMLKGLRAALLGDFEADVIYRNAKERKLWKGIFLEHFASQGIPVLHHLPVGHGKRNEPLPLGVRMRVRKDGKVELLEQPVTPS